MKVFKAQRALSEIGIHFDTGYGGGGNDWEWDWSLSGEHYKAVFNWFRKKRRYVRVNRKKKSKLRQAKEAFQNWWKPGHQPKAEEGEP